MDIIVNGERKTLSHVEEEAFLASLPVPDLAAVKAALEASIDTAAETERLKYITGGAGQAMTYQQKSDEAKRYLSADGPVDTDFPMLLAEVGITAGDIAGVAVIIDAAYRQWQQIGAAIESVRLGTKAAIDATTTVEAAKAAAAAASWP